jgi:OmcA/MtrC family decaheme c-type cytochrome
MHHRCGTARLVFLTILAALLFGCSADDGKDGTAGPAGPPGTSGPPGPPGPTGGTGGVPVDSADRINISVTSVTVPAGGGAPVVQLRLTNDLTQGLVGLPAGDIRFVLSQLSDSAPGSGASSEWQNYITRSSGGIPNAQGNTETASSARFVDNGDGSYQYTFAQALTAYPGAPVYDALKTHRLGVEIREQAPTSSNGIFDFVPAGGAPLFTRNIVDNDTCNACHDALSFHGGPRTDVTYCVTCHNPHSIDGDSGNTVDMKALIHNIHSGRDGYMIIGFGGSVHDYSDIQFPQDVRNCQTCHEESDADTPQASNWRLVANRAACGTCHYDDGDAGNGVHDYAIQNGMHPGGFNFADDTQCLDCHGETATVTNSDGKLVRVQEIHRIASLEASENFVFRIEAVRNVVAGGPPLEVDYSVSDASGTPYDIDTDPEFTACADGTSRLAIDIGWTTSDFRNTGAGTSNAAPLGINALGAGCGGAGTDIDGDGIFTAVASSGLPAGLAGSIAVALEGHPGVDLDDNGVIAGSGDRVAVTSAIAYFGIDGAAITPRRNAVAIEKCDDCHKQLSLHGNNRTDKPEVCAMCHNPNATDISRRVAGSDCVNTLGASDQALDFKNMIHGIHSGNVGLCGFGNSAHSYFDVVYPGHLNNCEGCHLAGGYYPVEPGTILGTTVDANDPSTPTDDVAVSPNSSVCSACHTSFLAAEHMKQNGGDFNATKAADSSLISSGVETCVLCHGPGRTADVGVMHGVDDFEFN